MLVNITEIHKAHGAQNKHKPNKFTSLIKARSDEVKTIRGRYDGGTFATPEIAAAYEQWIIDGVTRSFRAKMDTERAALNAIEVVLGVTLERQFRVFDFRIDGYDKENNIAYEIDGEEHQSPASYAKDMRREKKIKEKLGCEFVRIKV